MDSKAIFEMDMGFYIPLGRSNRILLEGSLNLQLTEGPAEHGSDGTWSRAGRTRRGEPGLRLSARNLEP